VKALMDSKKHISKAAGLRVAGALLVGGILAEVLATAFHPAHQDPNNHVAAMMAMSGDQPFTGTAAW
jgi:hypothetical protein